MTTIFRQQNTAVGPSAGPTAPRISRSQILRVGQERLNSRGANHAARLKIVDDSDCVKSKKIYIINHKIDNRWFI